MGTLSPSAVVGSFQEMLIEVMKTAENTTVKQRYENLEPGVGRSFHIPLMIQIATGKYWKQATSEERVNLASPFKRMSISTLERRVRILNRGFPFGSNRDSL